MAVEVLSSLPPSLSRSQTRRRRVTEHWQGLPEQPRNMSMQVYCICWFCSRKQACSNNSFSIVFNFPFFILLQPPPYREKLAAFLSAAHTTETMDLPKQPRGCNYLINLREDTPSVTAFNLFSRRSKKCLLQHTKSAAACPAEAASLTWKQRTLQFSTLILAEAVIGSPK